MFAVIKTGGKQYRVKSGDTLRVEKLAADAGEKIQFNEILMVGGDNLVVGAPFVKDAGVQAEVVDQIKGDKLIHFVKRRRKHSSQRTKGHRQQLTLLKITDILADGAEKSGVKAAIGAGSVSGAAIAAAAPKAEKKADAPKAEAKAAPKAEKTEAKAAPKKRSCTKRVSPPLPRSPIGLRPTSRKWTRNCLSKAGSSVKAGSSRPKRRRSKRELTHGT